MRISELSGRGRHLRAGVMSGLLLSVSALAMGKAMAQIATSEQRSFAVPAGPLSNALLAFGQQAGLQVSYVPAVAEGATTSGVSGTLAPDAALSRILAGTGLSFRMSGGRTVTIERQGASAAPVTIEGAIALDTIIVSGGGSGPAPADAPYETPGSSNYISAEQIQQFRGTSAGDMFKSTPGVITATTRNGAGMDLNIRGLQGMGRNKITIDGAMHSTTTWRGYYGVDDRAYVDPDMIGGVSVEKGPTSDAAGAGVIGGVVAITTLTTRDIVKDGQEWGVRIRGGTHDNAIGQPGPLTYDQRTDAPGFFDFENGSGSIALGFSQANFDFVAAAARRSSGNYFAGTKGETHYSDGGIDRPLSYTKPGEEVFNTSQDVFSALAKATWRWEDGQAFELGYMRYENDFGEITQSSLSQNSGNSLRQVTLAEVAVDTYTARYRWSPDDPLYDLRFNVWATHLDSISRSIGPGLYYPQFGYISADDPRPTVTTAYGTDLTNTSKVETPLGGVKLNYGATFSHEFMDGEEYWSRVHTRDRPVIMQPSVGVREIGGAFSRADWSVTDWLTVHSSLRYDAFRIEDHSPSTHPDHAGDISGGRLNPMAGFTLKPVAGVQLFTTYTEGFRPPTLRETIGSDANATPNPDLDPEVAKNWEFGANYLGDGLFLEKDKLRFKAAYFINNYDNYISRVSRRVQNGDPDRRVFTFENLEHAMFTGVEVSGSYDAGLFFGQAAATYYTDFEFCRTASTCASNTINQDYALNHLPPEWTASLTLGMRFFDEALTVGGRVTWAGERLAPVPAGEWSRASHWVPYAVVDAFASYKFDDTISLDVGVENMFDLYYIDALEGYMPSPGRTIRSTLTMRF